MRLLMCSVGKAFVPVSIFCPRLSPAFASKLVLQDKKQLVHPVAPDLAWRTISLPRWTTPREKA